MTIWDDPSLADGGEFVEFTTPGDTVSGTVRHVRLHTFEDGKKVPQILLTTDTGEDRTVTAGQYRLKNELRDRRVETGDWLKVTFTGAEPIGGGKTVKNFTVEHRPAGGNAGVPATPPSWAGPPPATVSATPPIVAVPQAPINPEVAAAALAALSPEQRAALGV